MKIVISYRRADSAAIAGRILDRLVARYGAASVFIDIDGIPVGVDFRDHVRRTLEHADAVVVIVGPRWTGPRDGGARIRDDDDPVRVEIEATLSLGVPLCPVLVDGAAMPAEAELPATLARFPYLNATVVDSGRDFDHHAGRLIAALDTILGPKAPPPPPPPSTPLALRLRWYAASAALLVAPAAASAAGLTPPWPPGTWIVTAVVGVVLVALLRAPVQRLPRTGVTRIIAIASAVLVLAAAGYFYATSAYVYQVPSTNVRLAKGFVCTPEAKLVYLKRCPQLGLDELREAEFEAERLWTPASIATVRVGLDALWAAAFIALAVLAAALVIRTQVAKEAA
ncbi:MAG TPA: toll/interleukin-1 receptor domain-containing protein [Candidatus Elarobacter sp.]|nr:toll/interleukin-1 receptor domain-containing protein [Candidatus Elarobacter sp.]